MVTQSRNSYVEADLHAPTIDELCKQLEDDDGTYQTHMEGRLQNLLKEAREKSKCWVSCSSSDNTELYYKKVSVFYVGVHQNKNQKKSTAKLGISHVLACILDQ